MKPRIILAGGSGFLGGVLARYFAGLSWDVVVLSRNPRASASGVRTVQWDARTAGDWAPFLDGAETVVNLTGRTVDCRYTAKNRREIMESRVISTRAIGRAILGCARPPRLWCNASSATLYRHTYGEPCGERGETGATPEAHDAFSVEVIRAWETEWESAETPDTRKVALRTAMVLGDYPNSVFPVLRRLTRFGLGGPMAGGRQFVSWIHAHDFCRAVKWIEDHETLAGPVNIAGPNPVTNSEMMRIFREILGVRVGLPAERWMLEVGALFLRTETELILKSRRVIPERLLASGFQFAFPSLRAAVVDLSASGR